MAPKPVPRMRGPSTDNADERTWTLITNRSRRSKSTQTSDFSDTHQASTGISPQLESGPLEHRERDDPASHRRSSNGYPTFKSYSWHQDHATQNRERRGLIGHPDVLYNDYRKKRKRGLAMADTDDEESSSSEGDLDSLDTESDSTLDSESGHDQETETLEDSATEQTTPNQGYTFLRKGLVEFVYTLFMIWMSSARYIIPPEHRLKRPRKRTKRARMFIEETDPNDPNTILISPFDGYYHLACPFYLHNSNQHKSCVMKHSTRSIEDLVDHLESYHAEPPLCKICGKVFPTFKERNDHLRNETCEPPLQNSEAKESQSPHGVSQLQRVKILKRDNPRRTEEERWVRIYKTIFEADALPESLSPYLMDGEGLKFSLLNDYWRMKGRECAKEYLADHGDGAGGTEFARLCSLVLEDLRQKVLDEESKGSGSQRYSRD